MFTARNLFVEFGVRVFKLEVSHLQDTWAYKHHFHQQVQDSSKVFQAKVLAHAVSTWVSHANAFQEFLKFCVLRSVNPLECTPQLVNVFLLSLAQSGKTIGAIENICKSMSFCFKFFLVEDVYQNDIVGPVRKFVEKVCPRRVNLKAPFADREVRKIWNYIECKYKNLSAVPIVQLRTFVLAVIQYASFCRFSDLAVVKLDDVVFDVDYFKICIQYSKTDQAGIGQEAFVLKSVDIVRDPHMLMCVYLQRLDSYNVQDLYLFPPLS
jgi:site-specific recombinase XerD